MQRRLTSSSLISTIRNRREILLAPIRAWIAQRTQQERLTLAGGAIIIALIILFFGVTALYEGWEAQAYRYETTVTAIRDAEDQLKTHQTLLAQRREVEHFFRRVDDHQNPLSLLETLFKANLGEDARPRITETGSKNFGQHFRQTTFRISDLSMTSLEKLLTVVNALTNGKAPFLVTHLSIDKNESGGKLDVKLDVSTVSKGQVPVEKD
jgi:hypothetical protein